MKKKKVVAFKSSRKVVVQRIVSLEKEGKLTPQEVERDARPKNSPLHRYFEWNDSKAGLLYRLDQARDLISNVRAVISTTEHKYSYVSYIRDPRVPPNEQGYVSVEKLRHDKKWAREAIELEIVQVMARFERLREIAVPLGHQHMVDRMIANLQSFQRRIAAD